LDNLVKNGTITKEQETAVKKLFSISKKQGKNFRYSFNSGLNELVNKGILSKGQKNAVQNLLISCRKEHISNMTEFFRNRLDALVKKGTITQKQEESIIKDLTAFRHAS
jgi:polyhydroxyalkanoate synthesis regulator phasin